MQYQADPPGLAAAMVRMHWWVVGTITARLTIFALLMAVGPAYAAGLVRELFRYVGLPVGYWTAFAVCCVVVGGMLAWSAYRWRGSFLESEARGWDTGRASSRGEWELRQEVFAWVFLLDVFHWPFIQFYEALDDLKMLRLAAGADQGAVRGALAALWVTRGSLPTTDLLPGGRRSALAAYLELYRWADFSKDGKKLWLLSEARKRVEQAN